MWRRSQRFFTAGALALATLAAPVAAGATVVSVSGVTWISPRLNAPLDATDLGALASNTAMNLRVVLQPSDPTGLTNFIHATATPGNPLYHHYLSKGQFAARFGASTATIETVTVALQAQGLTVSAPSANRLVLNVRGVAGNVAQTFHTSFQAFRDTSGVVGYVATSKVGLDQSIAPLVAGVTGLSSFERPRALTRSSASSSPRPAASAPTACSAASSAATSKHEFLPADQANLYGLTSQYANGYDGTGRSVAVVEFAGYFRSDLTDYFNCFGLSNTVTDVSVSGGAASNTASTDGMEVELDIEEAAALAPGAAIYNYNHPNDGGAFVDTFSAIATDDLASSVSVSWGMCESQISSYAEQPILQQLAAQGQTVFVASGDSGSSSCAANASPGTPGVDFSNTVDDPSNSPWVTGVGGLHVDSINPLVQSVWGGLCSGNAPCGGGGGSSVVYARPSWQSGPGVDPTLGRQVPDLSVMADPRTGFLLYFQGAWHGIGGTSIGAPILGAMAAVGAQACGVSGLGFLNPRLYQMASSGVGFNDVTVGSNDLYGTGNYSAGPGYDMASGLGSPNATNFLPSLCAQSTSATVSPRGAGVSATWTLHYVNGNTDLVAGVDTVTLQGFAVGGLSNVASDYRVNGVAPRAVALTDTAATLTLGTNVAANANVTITAANAVNDATAGANSIEITDSTGYAALFAVNFSTSPVGAFSLSTTGSAYSGSSGQLVNVVVRDPSGATISGVTVAPNASGHATILPVNDYVTDVRGFVQFRVFDASVERVNVTMRARGASSAPYNVSFVNPWSVATTSVKSTSGALAGVPSASTNCGVVARTAKGAFYSTKTTVLNALTTTKGVARVPSASSDPAVLNGAGSSCLLSYVTKSGGLELVTITGSSAAAISLASATGGASATVSPGLARSAGTLYVASVSTGGHLYVTALQGATVTGVDVTAATFSNRLTTTGLALANAVALIGTSPVVAVHAGKSAELFSYDDFAGVWDVIDVASLVFLTTTGSSAITGNPTLVGGDSLTIFLHTQGGHFLVITEDAVNLGLWYLEDVTTSFPTLKAKSDAVALGGSTPAVAFLVGSTVTILSANGSAEHPWLPVPVTFGGVKSLFTNPNGTLGAVTGSALATFTTK